MTLNEKLNSLITEINTMPNWYDKTTNGQDHQDMISKIHHSVADLFKADLKKYGIWNCDWSDRGNTVTFKFTTYGHHETFDFNVKFKLKKYKTYKYGQLYLLDSIYAETLGDKTTDDILNMAKESLTSLLNERNDEVNDIYEHIKATGLSLEDFDRLVYKYHRNRSYLFNKYGKRD